MLDLFVVVLHAVLCLSGFLLILSILSPNTAVSYRIRHGNLVQRNPGIRCAFKKCGKVCMNTTNTPL